MPLIARLAISFVATAGLTIASVVWSESWFYGRWRPEDSAWGLVETAVGYGLAMQIVRYVTFRWRVSASNWKRVFLVGALYGWLIEGVLVTTVVDDLPLSVSYTGLAWHALFTVMLGWWWVPRVLGRPLVGSLMRLAALGVGVGLWASFWRFEEGVETPVAEFALFMTVTVIAYGIGMAIWFASRDKVAPSLGGSMVAIVCFVALAVLNGLASPLTVIGPALCVLALLALSTTKGRETPIDHAWDPAPLRSLLRLAAVAVSATITFAVLAAGEPVPTGWLFYMVTVPLAAALFVIAWVRAVPRR